jgi:phosphomannomutase
MKVNPAIFKSYDIRGIYPTELNEETALKIGQVFVEYTGAKKIVVGRDMRISSPVLYSSLVKGISSQGSEVCSIGQVPVEGMYFAVTHYGYDAGIMITASHNPKEYNGFKMIKKGVDSLSEVIRGEDLLKLINKELEDKEKFGEIKDLNIWEDYISHILSFVNLEKIQPFKVVVDAGSGMAGKVIPLVKEKLPIKIIPLNFELDGNFPAHESNPLLEESTKQIKEKIKEEGADFGFIFDGDADRVYLIDEKSNFIRGDVSLLFLASHFLKKYPGKGVAYNLICSKAVPEFIKKMGGVPIRSRVGFVNLMKASFENDGVLSGEVSGHYSFRDNFYFDSGFIAFLILLQVISESNKKVSEIADGFSPYSKSAEINFKVKDKEKILNKITKKYSDGKQDFLDGITVEYKDWWFNVRPSNTEPLLRLTIEADNDKILEKNKKALSSFFHS